MTYTQWYISLIVLGFVLSAIWCYYKSRRRHIVDNDEQTTVDHTCADAALECLVTMGWKAVEADRCITIALERCPDGDESELVNIALRL